MSKQLKAFTKITGVTLAKKVRIKDLSEAEYSKIALFAAKTLNFDKEALKNYMTDVDKVEARTVAFNLIDAAEKEFVKDLTVDNAVKVSDEVLIDIFHDVVDNFDVDIEMNPTDEITAYITNRLFAESLKSYVGHIPDVDTAIMNSLFEDILKDVDILNASPQEISFKLMYRYHAKANLNIRETYLGPFADSYDWIISYDENQLFDYLKYHKLIDATGGPVLPGLLTDSVA